MQLVEVRNAKDEKQFLKLPFSIYRNDPNWIAPLENDIKAVFDPEKNPVLKQGEVIRWLLFDNNGKPIGRVAAFIDYKEIDKAEYPCGGMGFFDCTNDKEAAFMLFDTCRQWLESKGMKAMEGPVNFGERDRFWGLLVEGFSPPSYMEAYNPPYYQRFFEAYGFQLYFSQFTYMMEEETFEFDRLGKIAKWAMRKPGYKFCYLDKKNLQKYVQDFVYIYNRAWEKFENFKPVNEKDIMNTFKAMGPVMIPENIWFCYVNDEPAGFTVFIPDVNDIFKHLDGKLNLWGKLKFLYYSFTTPKNKLKGLVFGILPKYQNLGLDAALIYHFYEQLRKMGPFPKVSISWIGSFNPKMNALMTAMNGQVDKIHYTYRKIFDPGIEFKPYSLGEYKKDESK
jgi:GNAT superfamily N-acetyltransferase